MKEEPCVLGNMLEERIQKLLMSIFSSHRGPFEDSDGPNEILEWDSLNHLNLTMAINNEFGIDLSFEEMLEIKTVADIKSILKKRNIC